MRETSVPPIHEHLTQKRITDLLQRQATSTADPVLYERLPRTGPGVAVRASEFRRQVMDVAKGLVAAGLEPGQRVGILGRTRYEWSLVDFAIWWAGCVSVPVYDSSSPAQIAWNLLDSQAQAVFVENQKLEDAVRSTAAQVADGSLEGLDDGAQATHLEAAQRMWRMDGTGNSLEQLMDAGREISDDQLEQRRLTVNLDDTATIIYTSGTTGPPKGCELTHRNFVFLCENVQPYLPEVIHTGAKTVLFLPLAHVFARMVEVIALHAGITLAHTPDVKNLSADLQRVQPSFILAVPRVFEKIMIGARMRAQDGGKLRSWLFNRAVTTGQSWSRAHARGRVNPVLAARHKLYDRLVYAKLREAMGGNVKWAISGGAALSESLAHFFHGIGLYVVEGYGLTETTAPIAANTPAINALGTVGRPLPGHQIRLGDDDEIQVRGPHVMARYHGRPDLTEEALKDGWFATGDLGAMDDRGLLRITGRKKEIIVTAGGKNVIPEVLEGPIRATAAVSQCMVIGEGRKFVAALITLDPETLAKQLEFLGLDPSMSTEQAAEHPEVISHIQSIVDRANRKVSVAESIRAFQILPSDLTVESGHLTPSMKLRRPEILRDVAETIEELYSRPAPPARPASDARARLESSLESSKERLENSRERLETSVQRLETSMERLREITEKNVKDIHLKDLPGVERGLKEMKERRDRH
ncbi:MULTISPECIES: AMP-dependent synthetase/ligase [Kocuria]|uniref:Acyl-CoA synthetase n=1 Tax=Kocuria subflava TaxID=1736139 RepID=A0A846TK71_9MICC|nr:long-chain fatty acid--CoA ligase [Kocuria sp. CPCC 104605]NKE08863.1 AMP-binding protein [Kocuria subflava]